MADQLLVNVVSVSVPPGESMFAVAHGLRSNGRAVTPTLILPSAPSSANIVGADETNLYLSNTSAGAVSVSIRCQYDLSVMAPPGQQPFVVQYGTEATPIPAPSRMTITDAGEHYATIPDTAKFVRIIAAGGGAGGASGECGDAAAFRYAGGGGAGATASDVTYEASMFPSRSMKVTVGAGGAGGASVTRAAPGVTLGLPGASGGSSSVAFALPSYNHIYGSPQVFAPGAQAQSQPRLGGAGAPGMYPGGPGTPAQDRVSTVNGGTTLGATTMYGAGGGGAGAGLDAAGTAPSNAQTGWHGCLYIGGGYGGNGGRADGALLSGGAGLGADTTPVVRPFPVGGGGGGGGALYNADSGNGGAGGSGGGGGGGGGAARVGFNSGAGGRGGNGAVTLIWW